MRYVATPAHHSYREGLFDVRRDDFLIATCEEAEARIIAFALNAVAEGHGLIEVIGGHVRDWRGYDGPTEGVAPHG